MRLKSILPILVSFLILFGIIVYLIFNPEILDLLLNLSVETAVILILLRLLFLALNGVFLKLFAAKLGVMLRFKEWIGLPYMTTMGNYLTPLSGGMLARAVYLKSRHALSFTHFATLLAANYLLTFWVAAFVGLILSLIFIDQYPAVWLLAVLLAVVWVGITAVLLFPIPKLPGNHRLMRMINQGIEGWTMIKQDRILVLYLLILTVVSVFLNGFTFWYAYRALSTPISMQAALLVSLSSVFSVFITITPGNLGIREAFVSVTSEIIGAGAGEGLLVALLIRASTLVSAFTLGPLFAFILTRELRPVDKNSSETM
ncbi:MAG: flippase-like domain-containing protein [Anaerolineae bacterium]|nr:flippase-like domain-containing protein [Anaerolineae bacterium]